MPQTDRLEDGKGGLRYNRCNVYKTPVDGNVSEVGYSDGPMFWDRGCGELLTVSSLFLFAILGDCNKKEAELTCGLHSLVVVRKSRGRSETGMRSVAGLRGCRM